MDGDNKLYYDAWLAIETKGNVTAEYSWFSDKVTLRCGVCAREYKATAWIDSTVDYKTQEFVNTHAHNVLKNCSACGIETNDWGYNDALCNSCRWSLNLCRACGMKASGAKIHKGICFTCEAKSENAKLATLSPVKILKKEQDQAIIDEVVKKYDMSESQIVAEAAKALAESELDAQAMATKAEQSKEIVDTAVASAIKGYSEGWNKYGSQTVPNWPSNWVPNNVPFTPVGGAPNNTSDGTGQIPYIPITAPIPTEPKWGDPIATPIQMDKDGAYVIVNGKKWYMPKDGKVPKTSPHVEPDPTVKPIKTDTGRKFR